MENKLTLRKIAPYLPYGLKIWNIDMGVDFDLTIQEEDEGIDIESILYYQSNWKLILRPLSDLTKEIEVNGKRFTPLIELYRCSNEYNYNEDLDYEFIDSWGAKGNILKVFHNRKKNEYTEFIFSKLSFRKDRIHSKGSYVFGMNLPHNIRVNSKLYNNHKLYNLLYIWNFDVFGLIEQGLAIDINTL